MVKSKNAVVYLLSKHEESGCFSLCQPDRLTRLRRCFAAFVAGATSTPRQEEA